MKGSNGLKYYKTYILITTTFFISLLTSCRRDDNNEAGNNDITKVPSITQGIELTPSPTPVDNITVTVTPTVEPTMDPSPTPSVEATMTPSPTPSVAITNTPTSKPIVSSNKVKKSNTVIADNNYILYKTGNLVEATIIAMDKEDSKKKELTAIESFTYTPEDFYLKDNYVYYTEDGSIYRVKINGDSPELILYGDVTILGFRGEYIFYYSIKSKEIIRIDEDGKENSRKIIADLSNTNHVDIVMTNKAIYYVDHGDNFLGESDPTDILYYVDLDTGKNEEIYRSYDIYDLKVNDNEVFFASISDEEDAFTISKANKNSISDVITIDKTELLNDGIQLFNSHTLRLLEVGNNVIYYSIDYNDNLKNHLYKVNTSGSDNSLFINIFDLENISPAAYFGSARLDSGYLILFFDCDEDPHEIFIMSLKDKSYKKLEPGYYNYNTIDIEGDTIYYAKSSEFDQYQEMLDQYKYKNMKLSKFFK